jgi:hypothetical protein
MASDRMAPEPQQLPANIFRHDNAAVNSATLNQSQHRRNIEMEQDHQRPARRIARPRGHFSLGVAEDRPQRTVVRSGFLRVVRGPVSTVSTYQFLLIS